MPSRRSAATRSLVGLLLVALAFAAPGDPILAAETSFPAAPGIHPAPERRDTDSGRLRGGLGRLVRAAQAGTLSGAAYLGFETAPVPRGEAVAVSLTLSPAGGEVALNALLAGGGRIANRKGSAVEAYLPASALAILSALTGIERAEPIIRPVPMATPGIGILGEGVALHGADAWQAAGVLGSGVKVGIIDGGFVGLTSRLGRELPSTIHARCYREVGLYSSTARSCEAFTEHGTAVAETIADMAPEAALYLADPVSMQDLESTVAWMTANGVKIINISLGFAFQGPGDGSSPPDSVYTTVNQAVKGGALWVNAAGNAGEDGWSGTWRDANHNDVLDFSGTDESNAIALSAGETVVVSMRWNDTWGRSANDYDLYVYGPNGSGPLAASEDPQAGHGDPVESLSFTPATSGSYQIVVQRASGSSASNLQLLVLTSQDSPLQHRSAARTLPSPADSANAGMLTVGAVAFDEPDAIEPYSSRGPTTDDRIKPDLVAADCTTTSAVSPFCGTSESAPYVSGAAALILSSRPSLTPAQLATWLRTHAVPLGSPAPNSTFGWGRLNLGSPPAPPAPTSLVFSSQPALAVAQVPFNPAPTVQIRDQDGQPLTAGAGATASVTLALGPNSPGADLACGSGLTVAAVGGVATFTNCTLAAEATGVTLVATSGSLPSVTSSAFDVLPSGSAPAPGLVTSASAAAIVWAAAVTIRGQLSAVPGLPLAASLAGRTVTFERSINGVSWSPVGTGVTNAAGLATLTYRPVTNLYYRATFAGAADLGQAIGGRTRVTVRQTATVRPSATALTKTVARNQTVVLTTLVRPSRTDVPAGSVTFELYRRVGAGWQLATTRTVRPDATGAASVAVTFTRAGTWYVRSMARPTPVNANSLWTPRQTYLVR